MKKQFWLIGICILGILAACNRKPKDGLTDTYTSGVIAVSYTHLTLPTKLEV